MKYYLVCSHPPTEQTEIFPLRAKKVLVGRGIESSPTQIAIPFDVTLSRQHFSVQVKDFHLEVAREKGRQPLLVDGAPLERFTLAAGQSFRASHCKFQFVIQGQEERPQQTFHLSAEQVMKAGQARRFLDLVFRISPVFQNLHTPEQLFPEFLGELAQAAPEITGLLALQVHDTVMTDIYEYRRGSVGVTPSRLLAAQAIERREPVYFLQNIADRGPGVQPTLVLGMSWVLAAPIFHGDQRYVIFAGGRDTEDGGGLGEQGRALVGMLAQWASQHLQLARAARLESLQESQRREKELAHKLLAFTTLLASTLRIPEVLDRLLHHLSLEVPFDQGWVLFLEEDGSWGCGHSLPSSGDCPAVRINQRETLPLRMQLEGYPEAVQILVPVAQMPPACVLLARAAGPFLESELTLLQLYVAQAQLALSNARLHQQAELLARTDDLTGLPTQLHFLQDAEAMLGEARASGKPFSIMIASPDQLNQLNTQHGRPWGDELLHHLAQVGRTQFRPGQVFGRLGGGFAAATLHSRELAWLQADQLRRHVEENPLDGPSGPMEVTISLGVATADPAQRTLEEVIEQAHRALYQARQEGQNLVKSALFTSGQ